VSDDSPGSHAILNGIAASSDVLRPVINQCVSNFLEVGVPLYLLNPQLALHTIMVPCGGTLMLATLAMGAIGIYMTRESVSRMLRTVL